jgi:hypothetical protein
MITIKAIELQDLSALSRLYHELIGTPSNEQQM